MTLTEVKKMFKTTTVQSWIEAGVDVVAVGDKMVVKGEKFSRLDMYEKDNALQFCATEDECVIPCGRITFDNGDAVYYNITRSMNDDKGRN